MVKKQKSFLIYIIIAIVLVIGGILLYNFLKEKDSGWIASSDEEEVSKKTAGEIPSTGEETGIIAKIKNIFTGGGSSGGGGSSSSGGSSSGSSPSGGTSTETITYETDQTICQNAQNNNLCGGLDLTYGEGYRTLCCSEHNLCC